MPSPSEFKILRDEMAKLVAEVKKRDVHLKEADPDFYFFMEHYNHDKFLENLKLPLGYE